MMPVEQKTLIQGVFSCQDSFMRLFDEITYLLLSLGIRLKFGLHNFHVYVAAKLRTVNDMVYRDMVFRYHGKKLLES